MTGPDRLYAGLLVVGAVALTACDQPRDTGAVTSRALGHASTAPQSETDQARDVALVRAVNALPGAARVSISADDSTAFGAVTYKMATSYREIPGDAFTFRLRTDGAELDTRPLAKNRQRLRDSGHYTIVAMPDEGRADKANLRVLDDGLVPVTSGMAHVRFINAVPGQEVDVVLRGRAEALFDGVGFKSKADWKEVAPVSGGLEVRPPGEDSILARLGNVKLERGRSYTYVLTGRAGGYEIITIVDDLSS